MNWRVLCALHTNLSFWQKFSILTSNTMWQWTFWYTIGTFSSSSIILKANLRSFISLAMASLQSALPLFYLIILPHLLTWETKYQTCESVWNSWHWTLLQEKLSYSSSSSHPSPKIWIPYHVQYLGRQYTLSLGLDSKKRNNPSVGHITSNHPWNFK